MGLEHALMRHLGVGITIAVHFSMYFLAENKHLSCICLIVKIEKITRKLDYFWP